MENAKDKTSRSGSKVNLNESSLPLLEDEDEQCKTEKVVIEMEIKGQDGGEEKSDSGKEKVEGEDGQIDGEANGSDSKKKEKKKKVKKEKGHTRSCSISDRLTAGLNLLDRDDRSVNNHVNIVFEDVLAEPESNHGFDGVWRLAFLVFSGTKLWVYRVISALLALPCGLLWGLIFSLLTLLNVWVISPTLRLFDVFLHIIRRVWSGIICTFLDPIFQSVGQCFSGVKLNLHATREEP